MALRRAARWVAPAAVPFLLAVVLFAPATLGGKVLSASDLPLFQAPFPTQPLGETVENAAQFDAAYVFEPDGLEVREALRDGRLPVWSSALSAGVPLLASQQSAPLYPLNWIGVVLPYWESLAWIAVLKLTLAALGTFLLARALGLGVGPAALGAIAFGFGTYLITWLMHPHGNAYVVLPWLFLLSDRLCRTGRVRDAAALAAALGVAYLSGQPESGLIVSLATAAWVIHRLASARPPRDEMLRAVILAAGAAALGAALAAVMILPFVEALRESHDTSRSVPPFPTNVGITPFFPGYWGRPDRAAVAGPGNFTERTLYVGVLPTVLAAAGLFARRPRGPQLFFAGLAVGSLAVAIDTGPIAKAVRGLPVMDAVDLDRLFILASFAIAMLAAIGLERLLVGTAQERRRMLVAAVAVSAVPALAVLVAYPSRLGDLRDAIKQLLGGPSPATPDVLALASVLRWLVLGAIALTLLAAVARRRARAVPLLVAIVALAALDLVSMGWGYNPAIPKAQADPPTPPAVRVMRRLTSGGGRVIGVDSLIPNTASRWGLEDARGHELPVVERTTRLWYALGGGIGDATRAVSPRDKRTPKLLDVFGVRAVLFNPSAFRGAQPILSPPLGADPIAYRGPGGVVVEHRTGLPRAFVAYRWRRTRNLDESLFFMAASTSRQARDEPILETGDAPPGGPAPPATPASVISRSDTEVTLDVRARAAGRLVLLDTFYPGWRAEVDGRRTPITAANAAFQSIPVGPGRHKVRFYYHPTSVVVGGAISLAALAFLAGGLLLGLLRARRTG